MEKKWIAAGLLIIFFLLATFSMLHNSATSDEVTHITSGYSYWKYFDYTFNPEHPPLIKLWATLPLLIINPSLPGEPASWTGDQWDYAKTFLYNTGNDADLLYFWSRSMIIVIGIVLGYYIYRWATELYGWKAGLLALLFYVFDPNIIAHSTIVHTDIPISATIFILLYYFWKFIQRETLSWKQILILGILLGIANATKFTGLYVLPILFVLYFVHLYFNVYTKEQEQKQEQISVRMKGFYTSFKTETMKKEINEKTKIAGVLLGIALFIVIITYGFVHISSYFVGLASVTKSSVTNYYGSYLLGMYSSDGWWYYFIIAFLVKTPAPTLLLLLGTFFLFFKTKMHKKNAVRDALFLLIPATLYFLAFLPSTYNIGVRHILPVYPFLFVFMSSVVTIDFTALKEQLRKYTNYAKYILFILIAWLVFSTAIAYPYYIPYFNEFVGGSQNGHKILLDSNLDWGQGLKETAVWLEEHENSEGTKYLDKPIRMGYFGNEDPAHRGIISEKILCSPAPGLHIISANKLYDFQGNQLGCTDWLFNYDPLAVIGYSIYIYDITDPIVVENYNSCKMACTKACAEEGQKYDDSIYTDKCICISCKEATNEDLGII